jgi:hypothetical protein
MTGEERISASKQVLAKHLAGKHYDVVSAGVCPWEDAPAHTVVAVTIKYRSRANLYEVYEFAFYTDDNTPDDTGGTWARVASTGEGDSSEYVDFAVTNPVPVEIREATLSYQSAMQWTSDLGFVAACLLEHRRSSEADMSSAPKGYNPVVKDRLPMNMYERLEQIARRDRGVIRRGN